jgi:hypothetical protein
MQALPSPQCAAPGRRPFVSLSCLGPYMWLFSLLPVHCVLSGLEKHCSRRGCRRGQRALPRGRRPLGAATR